MIHVWISAAALCTTTLLGTFIGFGFKNLSHKWNDTVIGFCAGVMLAASTIGLIIPAFDLTAPNQWYIVVGGVIGGALFLNILDLLTPHLHHLTGLEPEKHKYGTHLSRVMLFVLAIALHKFPEGIAAGVSLSGDSAEKITWGVTFGLSLQNIPEGMVIIAPLMMAGVNTWRTIIISLGIGFIEITGVWTGFAMGSLSETMLPIMLGFSGGAMLYVTSDEMIPETHAHGYQKRATYALLLGFLSLLIIERLFE